MISEDNILLKIEALFTKTSASAGVVADFIALSEAALNSLSAFERFQLDTADVTRDITCQVRQPIALLPSVEHSDSDVLPRHPITSQSSDFLFAFTQCSATCVSRLQTRGQRLAHLCRKTRLIADRLQETSLQFTSDAAEGTPRCFRSVHEANNAIASTRVHFFTSLHSLVQRPSNGDPTLHQLCNKYLCALLRPHNRRNDDDETFAEALQAIYARGVQTHEMKQRSLGKQDVLLQEAVADYCRCCREAVAMPS